MTGGTEGPAGTGSSEQESARSILPNVGLPRAGLPIWAIAALAIGAALILFATLEARRQAASAPAVASPPLLADNADEPPPLYIPPTPLVNPYPQSLQPAEAGLPSVRLQVDTRPAPPPAAIGPAYATAAVASPPQALPALVRPERVASGPTLVIDNGSGAVGPEAATNQGGRTGTSAVNGRARAGAFANRATSIAQGTLIPAVLETGFVSSRSGFARALVQRDVRGFDGTRVLIPRGSRLIGEYAAETAQGQKRALINWTRLIRPDGATIAIGSPATDPVGRGGVKATVDTHFLERFSGAILQSALDLGVTVAARKADAPVVVALPGSFQGATGSVAKPSDIPPTLRVAPGTSVSVFVARDLDFTDVENPR